MEHSDSVDTGYCDACSVHGMVDSNSSGMSSVDNHSVLCGDNCKQHTSTDREESQDTRNSEQPKQTSQDSLQDVSSVDTADLHSSVPACPCLPDSIIVPKREHALCGHDHPSDIISAECPFNRPSAGFHETIMTDNDTLYNKIPNSIT